MQNSLSKILEEIRLNSQSEFEKGHYFEQLVKVYLENDTLQGQNFDKIWFFKDWYWRQEILMINLNSVLVWYIRLVGVAQE